MCILPSSLTRGRSCALDYSSHLRVSVYGTVPSSLTLDSISWHLDYVRFASTFSPLDFSSAQEVDFPASLSALLIIQGQPSPCRISPHASWLRNIYGIGIFTDFPSTTRFRLALGADLPGADCLYPGNLRFSADGNLTRLFVTYTCILSSVSSSTPRGYPFIG